MDIRPALKSQYHAALWTVRQCIEACPDSMWADPKDGYAAFWRGAYHTLFFTHMYLQKDHASFVPWSKHQEEAEDLGPLNGPNGQTPKPSVPHSKQEILDYWSICDAMIDPALDAMDLESPTCGFSWYSMGKLEHQLVNLRHIQHHAAALSMRLRLGAGIDVRWVGRVKR
jgi:hypothetical protein